MGLLDKIRPASTPGLFVDAGEFRIHLQTDAAAADQARAVARGRWEQIDAYLRRFPGFGQQVGPQEAPEEAPVMVQAMAEASRIVDVQPAAVLIGALVEAIGSDVGLISREATIACEGVSYNFGYRTKTLSVDQGGDQDAPAVGIRVRSADKPFAFFTSSGRSRLLPETGGARAVAVVGERPPTVEAVGIAMGRALAKGLKLGRVLAVAQQIAEVRGGVILTLDQIGVWGGIEVVGVGSGQTT